MTGLRPTAELAPPDGMEGKGRSLGGRAPQRVARVETKYSRQLLRLLLGLTESGPSVAARLVRSPGPRGLHQRGPSEDLT